MSAHWLASLGRAGNSDDEGSRGLGSGCLSPVQKQEKVTLQPSTLALELSSPTGSARGCCLPSVSRLSPGCLPSVSWLSPVACPPEVEVVTISPPTLTPQPSTLNPQPSTLNPRPSILNPRPSPLNPQPSTLNPQPSTLSPQPSPLTPQPSAHNPQPLTPKP